MAQTPNDKPIGVKPIPVKPKPVSKDRQILRQQQILQDQQKRKNQIQQSSQQYNALPQVKLIDDKYIFGLANNNDNNDNNDNDNNDNNNDDIDIVVEEQQAIKKINSRYMPGDYSTIWEKKEFLSTSSGGNFCCYSTGIKNNNLVFVCLHGCGHSALSYSLIASYLKDKYQIFSFDYRAHGYTTFNNNNNNDNDNKDDNDLDEEYKMSKENLVSDIIEIIKLKYGTDDPPPIVLVGHSLGGALAVHTAQIKGSGGIPSLVGIVVIDLVEGTAVNSLVHMRAIINRRPKSFNTINDAIKYCSTSGMIRNYKSAQLSVPPMFIKDINNKYVWRTNVLLTEPFWRNWFINLSSLFLKSRCSKMLMLADTDRLDKPLTIGQMQGKYQLCIIGCGVGHTLHEDAPKKVADKLIHFAERNQFIKLWKINKKFKLKISKLKKSNK